MSKDLPPINKINLEGKEIRKVFFAEVSGGDKMYILFTDNTILVMPVYRECKVQVGKLSDFLEDRNLVINQLKKEMTIFCSERQKVINFLQEEVDNGLDGSESS